jgi:hypothetical protein
MIVLCIAIGGFSAVFRVDLMVVTIIRAFPAYLVILGLIVGATVASYYINEALLAKFAPAPGTGLAGLLGKGMLIHVLLTGATIYADVVSLRSIGLFYHHFKHKFAWNWG